MKFNTETFEAYNPPLEEITASCDNCGKSFPANMGRGTGQADSRIYFGNGKEIGYTSRDKRISGHEPNRKPILSCKECWETMTDYEWNPPASLFDAETYEAAVVSRSVPKTPLKKAMLNKAMMDKAEIEEAILDLETRVRLGLISEDEVMRKLHHRFGSEEEFVSCPHCEGSGSIADPSTYLPATREDPAEVDSMECPYCEGSGEVPEDEADEIPAYDWDYYRPNPDDRWDNYDRHEGRYDSESPKGIGDLRAGDKNLAGANLAGANLSGANLIDTNLENAILSNANLKSANLSGANLKGARIDFANLNSANLSGANLENVYANRATFRKANFKGANLDKVNFRQADLRGANLEDVKLNFSYQFHSFGGAELIDVIGLTDENKKLIAQDKGIFSEKDWDDYYGNHAEEEGSKAFMVAGITILSALSFGIYKRWKS